VSFNGSGSSDSDGSITLYAWSFGEGGSSSGVTASHTYSSAGTYTARLTVTDDDGATDTTTTQIEVSAPPVAQDLYVNADSGSDTVGNGTSGNPFKTITRALAVTEATPGIDIIHIATGIYNTALGELFPLRCVEVDLLGEGTTPDDVKIIGTVNVLWNSSLQDVRCYTNVTVGGTDALVKNVVLKDDTYPVAIFADGTRLVVEDCLIETGVGGIKASGDEITIRNNSVRHTNRYGWYGVYVMDGDVVVTGNSIENEQKGIEMTSGVAEGNRISNCEHGISIDGTTSPVVLRGNSISDDLAGNNTNVAEGVVVRGNAEVILENNNIGPVDDSGVSIFDTAIVDLGGGTLGSTGGNTLSGSLPNILDDRVPFSAALYAKQNVWNNPQPAGTVDGPILNSPNYRITKEGNSIIFSD